MSNDTTASASIDTAEFRRLSYAYAEALFKGTVPETSAAWGALVDHINRRAPVQAAQPALPAAKVIVNDGNGTATIMLAPSVTLPVGTSLYLAAPAQTTDARHAAWYRVLRQHVAPFDVAISMRVPAKDIPPEQSIEERIDMLCDQALKADRATHPTDKGQTNE